MNQNHHNLQVCTGTGCDTNQSFEIKQELKNEIIKKNLQNRVKVETTGCQGICEKGPIIVVQPDNIYYQGIKKKDIPLLVEEHFLKGKPVKKLIVVPSQKEPPVPRMMDIGFFKHQRLIVLRNRGRLDPENIEEYIGFEGYQALEKALTKMSPKQIIEEIKKSGLRGRGGAGFPTGKKWELCHKSPGKIKYIICNGDEGDPGAFMDRSILEADPHAVIEGMVIGARAIGARQGFIYVRSEYPLAVQRLELAINQAEEYGLLGDNIFGTGFNFSLKIIQGAGAFVCGEETALIASIQGDIGRPRSRPPYPAEKGLWDKPTNINNVETWTNIPRIILRGADWFSSIGTETSKGTKIFSLVGKINNTGLVEVPMGITLREIVEDIGGGIPGGKKFKGIQTGGPSGGCIPEKLLDLPIDYESLNKAGSIMGSGGMIVMDDDICMVDLTRYFLNFTVQESCGKCTPCRVGTRHMVEFLNKICKGQAEIEDLEKLESLAKTIKATSLCGLGQTAPNPVLSTMLYFKEEYIDHIKNKHCSAGICSEIVGAPCQNSCPLGTEAWRYVAYIANGEYKKAYQAIREANPFPSVCARVCSHPCEYRCRSRTTGGQAIFIRALKRFITDRIDPSIYKPVRAKKTDIDMLEVAIVGAGPAGLTAAHYLSLKGYKITIFEKANQPGGMLSLCIPEYRMPRDVLKKEIKSLLDENITLECNTALGSEISINSLFKKGYKAIFLAMGAHKSRLLNIEGEEFDGVYPAIDFLKSFNIQGKKLAKGHVGVIGGGDSAIDAARISIRQEKVKSVTIFYRRTRVDIPALEEEVESALQEGVELKTLISPLKILPQNNHLKGVEFISNKQGKVDSSGRRKPIPIPGTEHFVPLNTLIITIGDVPDIDYISTMGIEINDWGTLKTDKDTLSTSRPGVFAGGDVITGPSTVVEAIAAGKKTAIMIDRYLRGEELKQPPEVKLPEIYIEPPQLNEEEIAQGKRVELPKISIEKRKQDLSEVELTLSVQKAKLEARRCMRCDLEFTDKIKDKQEKQQ
ncbi:MAG: NADH-quinone oxidoreductase subunit NuoF [Candidatus Aminicenantes bacterium]|nr:NADH-quinone oxidoreductase subunit NuoF [Candidatus Aminicenantes bacterium]